MIEDEMVEWHHHLDGHEFEQTLGDSEEQEAWHAAVHSRVRLFASPWTAANQAPLSMGFSRQEYWSGVPLAQGLVGVKRLPVHPAVFPPSLSVGVPLPK